MRLFFAVARAGGWGDIRRCGWGGMGSMVLGWSGRRKIGSLAHGMFSTALVRVDRLWRGRDLQYKDFFSFLFVFLSLRYGHTSVTLAGVLTHMCGYSGLWLWLGKRQKQKSYVINAVWSGMPCHGVLRPSTWRQAGTLCQSFCKAAPADASCRVELGLRASLA